MNDAFLKGTVEIDEFRFAFHLMYFNYYTFIVKNDYGRPPTKGVDTGPSCKELRLFKKYNCFSFDLHVSRLILECEGKKYEKTDPRPSSPVCHFLA